MFSFITHTTVLCLLLLNLKNPFEIIFIGFFFYRDGSQTVSTSIILNQHIQQFNGKSLRYAYILSFETTINMEINFDLQHHYNNRQCK